METGEKSQVQGGKAEKEEEEEEEGGEERGLQGRTKRAHTRRQVMAGRGRQGNKRRKKKKEEGDRGECSVCRVKEVGEGLPSKGGRAP